VIGQKEGEMMGAGGEWGWWGLIGLADLVGPVELSFLKAAGPALAEAGRASTATYLPSNQYLLLKIAMTI